MALFSKLSGINFSRRQNKDVAPPKEPKKLSREEEEETKNDDDNSKADAENVDETTENLLSVSEAVPVSETAKIVESMQKPIEKENDDDMFMQEESYQEVEGNRFTTTVCFVISRVIERDAVYRCALNEICVS